MLIGNTLGYGIRGLAGHFETALRAASERVGLDGRGAARARPQTYRDAEDTSHAQVSSSGGGL